MLRNLYLYALENNFIQKNDVDEAVENKFISQNLSNINLNFFFN